MTLTRPLAAALALLFSAAANASLVMNWTFTGDTSGSGTITARGWDDTLDGSFTSYMDYLELNGGGSYARNPADFYVVTSATGTINGVSITLMDKYASTYNQGTGETTVTSGFAGNDNVVLEPHPDNLNAAARGYFTPFGLSFDANGTYWNLFTPDATGTGSPPMYQLASSTDPYSPINVAFTLEKVEGGRVDAVPLPASTWLLLSGAGGLFVTARRRRQA